MRSPARARIVFAVAAAGLGLSLVWPRGPAKPKAITRPELASETTVALPAPRRSPEPAAAAPPVSVEELLEHGSKEPLVPRELDLGEVELAPGEVATEEPLVPPDLDLGEVALAPGEVATAAPLVPREHTAPSPETVER